MEQTIEVLCEKFGITIDGLVNELFRYHTTMDKIDIAVWGTLFVISILSFWIFGDKFKRWWNGNSWRIIIAAILIALIFIGLIVLPIAIYDLIEWYVSPLGAALKLIM